MKESRFKPLLLVASWSFFVVVFVGVWFAHPGRQSVTLGQLATKDPPTPLGHVLVSNCVGGTRHGRFIVFKSPVEFRYTVVFVLVSDAATEGTVFDGSCVGVRVTPMADCPCDPPFVLVTGASESSAKTD